jgi:hypoxanthine phosphoribosyltransferase
MGTGHSTLITAGQIRRRVKEMAAAVSRDYSGRELIVVSVLKGSIIFLADLLRLLDVDFALDFMSVSSYKGSASRGKVDVLMDLRDDPKGRHVLIIEDIVDSGRTLSFLVKRIKEKRPLSVKTCVLLDKPSARQVRIKADYTGFRIKNEFVVGYGLDYDEKYRGLPYIAALKMKKEV